MPHADDPPRRVLVLAYYFPPLGGSGVQRVAKLAKYLPGAGWQPTVVTARPGRYFAFDAGLADEVRAAGVEVVATPTLDPTRGGQGAATMPSGARAGLLARLSAWAFVPDNKVGWAPFALAAAGRMHHARPFDAVYATAPPYTGLLVGARLARRWGVPLVVDLRDDWLGNPRHVYPTRLHRRLHAALEGRVFGAAASIHVISDAMREAVAARHPALADRVRIVPQGFDPEDFPPRPPPPVPDADAVFRIVYTGVFYDAQRPDVFLAALARFARAHPDARVAADFYGLVPPDFAALVAAHGLGGIATYHGYAPHADVARHLADASMLWLTIGERAGADGISTGKLYDYFGARRPILGLVPPSGTAAAALRRYGAGTGDSPAAHIVAPTDTDGAAAAMAAVWTAWLRGARFTIDAAFVHDHDRRRIAATVGAYLSAATERAATESPAP